MKRPWRMDMIEKLLDHVEGAGLYSPPPPQTLVPPRPTAVSLQRELRAYMEETEE